MHRKFWLGLAAVGVGCGGGADLGMGGPRPAAAQTLLRRLEDRLNELVPANAAASDGRESGSAAPRRPSEFEPGFLGLMVENGKGRVKVSNVRAGSPAQRAGFSVGDGILAVNGRVVRTTDEFAAATESFPAGARLTFETVQGVQRQRLVAVLAERTATPRVVERPERQAAVFVVERPSLGIRVAAVTDDARREHGLSVRRGAFVAEVVPEGAFAKAELKPGIAVVAADGRRIDSPQDLSDFVRGTRVGQEIEFTYYEGDQLRKQRVRVGTAEGAEAPDEPEAVPTPRRPLTAEPADPERLAPNRAAPERLVPERVPAERGQPLKRLERVLEGFSRPVPESAPSTDARNADVRFELSELRDEVTELRRRVRELERRLESFTRRPGADETDDDRPGLIEPELKAPKNERPATEPKLELKPTP